MKTTIIRALHRMLHHIKGYHLVVVSYILISFLGIFQLLGTSKVAIVVPSDQEQPSLTAVYRQQLLSMIR